MLGKVEGFSGFKAIFQLGWFLGLVGLFCVLVFLGWRVFLRLGFARVF